MIHTTGSLPPSPLSFFLSFPLFFSCLFVQCQERIQERRDNERTERAVMSGFIERVPLARQRIEETEI